MRARASLLVALALAGCAGTLAAAPVCERPASLDVALASGPLLNPDPSGTPLPTEIRVLALREPDALASATFEDAWQPSGALAAAIVSTEVVTLYPGESAHVAIAPGAEVHALAALAIVRQPAGRTWRVVVPVEELPCGSDATLALRVDEYRIEREGETRRIP